MGGSVVAFVVLIVSILALLTSVMGICDGFVDAKPRLAVACAAALVASLVLLVVSAGTIIRDERNDRIRGAQACLDAGGTPFRATKNGGVTCLYRSQR
jgi:hypothetical protein